LHAAVAKWSVAEWSNGTILYYWFNDPFIGAPSWLKPLMMPVLTSPFVAILTWGSLVLEIMLFTALVMPKKRRAIMLIAGILFHGAIALTMGLVSFGIAMSAALVLYLRPVESEFSLEAIQATMRQLANWLGRERPKERQQAEIAPSAVPRS